MQSIEGLVVGRQDEHVVADFELDRGERLEPLAERIRLGLGRKHRDVRGDLGQHLVPRDEHAQIGAMQAQMLGRMTAADNRSPQPPADLQLLTGHDAAIAVWECVYHLAEAAEASLVVLDCLWVPACGVVEANRIGRRLAPRVGHQHAAGEVLEARHPQAAVKLSRQPPGHAHVVRMHVRADDAGHGASGHRP